MHNDEYEIRQMPLDDPATERQVDELRIHKVDEQNALIVGDSMAHVYQVDSYMIRRVQIETRPVYRPPRRENKWYITQREWKSIWRNFKVWRWETRERRSRTRREGTRMILDGKKIAAEIRAELREQVQALTQAGQRAPKLAVVIVGNNPASETYVANKIKACQEVGIEAQRIAYATTIMEQTLLSEVHRLNSDSSVDGFIVQLPLPDHINESTILSAIDYRKDVDGLTPESMGRAIQGLDAFISATPKGIRELLARYQITTEGKHVVVIGRSNIVGKPMAMLLMQRPYLSLPNMSASSLGDATVTVCHSKTRDLAAICRTADIIIVAAGSPKLLTANMVKDGAVVIDVGINRVDDLTSPRGYRLVGDVDFDNVAPKASFITPVPGGVGPMTIVSLLQNTLQAYNEHSR